MKKVLKKIPFSKQSYEELKTKEAGLQQKRKEVLVRLQTAREMGDLSENGAYKYAKFEIGNVNREIRHVTFLLKSAEIKESRNDETIDFGSVVTIKSEKGERAFTMVSGYESNPSENKLSIHSPLGRKLVHKRVNDMVTVKAPAGDIEYTIVAVK